MPLLTLNRKELEGVQLDVGGLTVIVTVAGIGRGRVALTFRAPEEVRILRCELLRPKGAVVEKPAAG